MARALVIEEESGTYRGHVHPHNGYYAGDFAGYTVSTPDPAPLMFTFSDGGSWRGGMPAAWATRSPGRRGPDGRPGAHLPSLMGS